LKFILSEEYTITMMVLSLTPKLRRAPVWAASLLALFVIYDGSYGESALDYWRKAQQLQEQGNLKQALELYTQGLHIEPQHQHAYKIYNNRGLLYCAYGNYLKALDDFNKAIECNPKDSELYYNRANAYRALKMVEQAILDYTITIQLDPHNALAYNNRGNLYLEKGNLDKAEADYYKAIHANPKDSEFYCNRGNLYRIRGYYDRALSDFDKAIALNPYNAVASHYRAMVHFDKGNYRKAKTDIDDAVRINPEDPELYCSRGDICRAEGYYDWAVADCRSHRGFY